MKVALTGGIATGKSYVLDRLRDSGVPVVDADRIVHQQFAAGSPVTNAIAEQFGAAILAPDGSVDRTLLGRIVFADDRSRHRLEAIVHPVVYETISRWFETIDRPFGVASVPLLFESGRERDFDLVIVTACSQELQVERLAGRGLSVEEAQHRIAAQLPTEQKVRRANRVISTDGSTGDTDRQVDDALHWLEGLSLRPAPGPIL